MGAPALVKEGLSWREVRLRALHTVARLARPGAAEADAKASAECRDARRQPVGAGPRLPAPGIRSRATSMLADAVRRQALPGIRRGAAATTESRH